MSESNDVQKRHIKQMEDYFKQYVLPSYPSKIFDSTKVEYKIIPGRMMYVWGSIGMSMDGSETKYQHDGVNIIRKTRVKTVKGDTDTFTDIFITTDGKVLVDEKDM